MVTADQIEKMGELFKTLGFAKPAAREEIRAVTGKDGAFKMTRGDGEKMIAHLKAKAAQPSGAVG